MPKTHISRSVDISKRAAHIYNIITDFKQWPEWSPWLIMDPKTDLNFEGNGDSYSWKSDRIGQGEMTKTKLLSNESMSCDLNFIKPWKSSNKVNFILEENGDTTKVTWTMDGTLPFFMFFMKKMMEGFVGMDFERGLTMLKEYAEKGKVSSTLDFKGIQSHPGFNYIGIKRELDMTRMEEMGKDFEKLHNFITSNSVKTEQKPFCIYHKFDVTKQMVKYTAGVPVTSEVKDLPKEFVTGKIPKIEVNTITHTGSYKYLGNVWSAQQNMMRAKEFKAKRGLHPWEEYENMPGEVPDNELVTHAHFGVK